MAKEDTKLRDYVSSQISNLFGEENEMINYNQLKGISQLRETFKKSHSRRIEKLPEPFIQKASGYMDMPNFQSQLLFNKQNSQLSYQTMHSSQCKLKHQAS